MKKIIVLFLIINFIYAPVLALELDTSIDDEIRKNYNPSKLEEDIALPALPKILNEKTEEITPIKTIPNSPKIQQPTVVQKTQAINHTQTKSTDNTVYNRTIVNNTPSKGNCAVLKKRTKIRVKSLNTISDKTKKGSRVSFVSKYPVTTTYFTIPMGTVFKGKVTDSHRPQLTGNGGLIVINIDSMIINGESYSLNAYVSKANYKNIFFNNIKGQRKYIKSMVQASKPGKRFFGKMMRLTSTLAGDGSSVIFTPFSFTIGVVVAGANIIVSPACAVFYKGGYISIPDGSDYELRLEQDTYIYN